MSRHLYERERKEKEGPIYEFEELRNLLQTKEPSLKVFFDQLYSAARPSAIDGFYMLSPCFIE